MKLRIGFEKKIKFFLITQPVYFVRTLLHHRWKTKALKVHSCRLKILQLCSSIIEHVSFSSALVAFEPLLFVLLSLGD